MIDNNYFSGPQLPGQTWLRNYAKLGPISRQQKLWLRAEAILLAPERRQSEIECIRSILRCVLAPQK